MLGVGEAVECENGAGGNRGGDRIVCNCVVGKLRGHVTLELQFRFLHTLSTPISYFS